MNTQHFYHSFPRPRAADTDEITFKKGLKILEEISRIGLILSPEVVTWHVPLLNGSERKTEVAQSRLCFTQLELAELPNHNKKFGPISLEFDISNLRRLGALPVIYMPQLTKGDRTFSAAGAGIVSHIGYTRDLLERLKDLQALTDDQFLIKQAQEQGFTHAKSVSPDFMVSLQNVDENQRTLQTFEISRKNLRGIVSYIGFQNAPFEALISILGTLQSLFYPTDDHRHDELLAYYQQREWRIVSGFSADGDPLTRFLTDAEKLTIIAIDPTYWTGKILVGKQVLRRIDIARVLMPLGGSKIESIISKIWVPKAIYDPAARIFGQKVAII